MDPPTSLPGRREFEEALARMTEDAKRAGQPVSLLIVDIDGFKRVHSTFGHAEGGAVSDRMLIGIAAGVRPQDFLARLSLDQFAVLLPNTPLSAAGTLAEQMLALVVRTFADSPRHRFVELPSKRAARADSGLIVSISLRPLHSMR
jgi:diguanylate cyclase (GGDEF)-like protein